MLAHSDGYVAREAAEAPRLMRLKAASPHINSSPFSRAARGCCQPQPPSRGLL